MLNINDTINFEDEEYFISSFLGQGGMGHVFLIKEINGTKEYALKTLHYYIKEEDVYRSLINEWQLAKSIRHDNVIGYKGFDDGLVSKTPYIIMDLATSGTLQNFLDNQKRLLDEQSCLDIFHQIIDGMEAINKVLVHRDIKPDNIFIDKSIFKVADFGLAKIVQDSTRSRTFKGWGTEPYMAPEAYRFEENTIQMDMYSIGLVFYQIACKKHAFGQPKNWEKAHLTFVPKALNTVNKKITPKVASVINKLIEKRPKDRYKSWEDVRQDLKSASENTGSHKNSVNKLLSKKLSDDLDSKKRKADSISKCIELQRRKDIVKHQYDTVLKKKLLELLHQLNNTVDSNEKAVITEESIKDLHKIKFSFNNKEVNIWFSAIEEDDYLSFKLLKKLGTKGIDDSNINKYLIPKLNNKVILAWGAVIYSNRQGFNLLLVQSEEDEYGDWCIFENRKIASPIDDDSPEPFAFDRSGLRLFIHSVDESTLHKTTFRYIKKENLIELITDGF